MTSAITASGTWCIWTFWRVVMCDFFSGAYFSAIRPNMSICSGVTPPKGSLTRTMLTSGWRWP